MIDAETKTKMERFCRNCVHSRLEEYWLDVGSGGFSWNRNMVKQEELRCRHPAALDASGEIAQSCRYHRSDPSAFCKPVCGPDGKLFSPKPDAWPRIGEREEEGCHE